jgi:hypothetical protein
LGCSPPTLLSEDGRLNATLTTRAEQLAREMATSAGTIDDLNARRRRGRLRV